MTSSSKKVSSSAEKDLKKATRSVSITLVNSTNNSLLLLKDLTQLKNGKWSLEPKPQLPPDEAASWICYTKDYRGTVEGTVAYHFAGDEEDPVIIQFGCLKDKAKSICEGKAPSGYQLSKEGEVDKHISISFILSEESFEQQPIQTFKQERRSEIDSGFSQDREGFENDSDFKDSNANHSHNDEAKDDFWSDDDEPAVPKLKVVIRSAEEIASQQTTNEELAEITKTVVGFGTRTTSFSSPFGDSGASPFSSPFASSSPFGPNSSSSIASSSSALSTGRAGTRRRPSPAAVDPQITLANGVVSSMKNCVTRLESGEFSTALQSAKSALNSLQTIKTLEERQKEFRIVLVYTIALELLEKIQSLGLNGEPSLEEFKLFLYLSSLPLHPKHCIVNYRRVINDGIKLNQYSTVKSYLEKLVTLELPDKENLQSLLDQCNQKSNSNLPLSSTFCYQTLVGIGVNSDGTVNSECNYGKCDFCEAHFSDISVVESNRCPYCHLKKLSIANLSPLSS